MRQFALFEPALLCPTGLCDVAPDPELVRIFAALTCLRTHGIETERHNYALDPLAFMMTPAVLDVLAAHGEKCLPIALVDDAVALFGRYPADTELETWFDLPQGSLNTTTEAV